MTRIGDKPRLWFCDLRSCKRVERYRDGERDIEMERKRDGEKEI